MFYSNKDTVISTHKAKAYIVATSLKTTPIDNIVVLLLTFTDMMVQYSESNVTVKLKSVTHRPRMSLKGQKQAAFKRPADKQEEFK